MHSIWTILLVVTMFLWLITLLPVPNVPDRAQGWLGWFSVLFLILSLGILHT